MPESRYYFTEDDPVVQDPEHHSRNLRSLLIMAEYSVMQMLEGGEYYRDRLPDYLQSLQKIKNLLMNDYDQSTN